ncbi:hypothetical protein ACFWGP_07500 [Agromyces sp. NPDC127015]|uniref:hypothetical protein n=1 Tax=Agromyces sp. NPDC127015 TaxID=3347108 RepID=UPI003656FA4D
MSTTPPEHEVPAPDLEQTEQPAPPRAALPQPAPPPARPNIHVSALIVWLTIFPLVAIVGMLSEPFTRGWHPVLRAFVLTLIVVPIAAYWVMPMMFKGYAALERRRAARHAAKRVP